MQKINGYTEEEARELIEFVEKGRQDGKTLTALFESFGRRHGRARGSVRNYYYALMKNEGGDQRIVRMLDGKSLSVGKIRAFTEEEAEEAIRSILKEKAKGVSVRKAIFQLAEGDDKLMLRLQNKYRNTLKKSPEKIAALEREMFGRELTKQQKGRGRYALNGMDGLTNAGKDALQKRLEREINALYDRLARSLKAENDRLSEENGRLRAEVERLQKLHK